MYFAHSNNWVRLANQSDIALQSRQNVSVTTGTLSNNGTAYPNITSAAKSYLLYSIQTDRAAWVRVYTTSAARSADTSRDIDTDPLPGSGVLAEVMTSQATTLTMTPATMGFNMDSPSTDTIYLAVTNRSGSSGTVNVTLTILKTEI